MTQRAHRNSESSITMQSCKERFIESMDRLQLSGEDWMSGMSLLVLDIKVSPHVPML